MIFPSVWREIFAGRDPQAAAKKLAEMGMLLHDADTYQKSERLPGQWKRSKKFYVVTDAALGVAEIDGGQDA